MSRLRGLLCSLLGEDVQEMTCRKVEDGPTANDHVGVWFSIRDISCKRQNQERLLFGRSDDNKSDQRRSDSPTDLDYGEESVSFNDSFKLNQRRLGNKNTICLKQRLHDNPTDLDNIDAV